MRRTMFLSILFIVGLFVSSTRAFTVAEEAHAPLPQGATGVVAAVPASMPPAAAPGYELQVLRSVWLPGSSISMHSHPGALVSCVESGVLTFEIQSGTATVTRAQPNLTVPIEVARAHPSEEPEAITAGAPITYGAGDCVAFDEEAAHTVHTAWNEGTDPVVVWETHLYRTGEPATTFVNELGTPVP